MSTEQLGMLIEALNNVGGDAKEVLIWYFIVSYVIPYITVPATVLAIATMIYKLIKKQMTIG